jgi:anti-sigma regulatory factor (Ser/Thr protein kinase)
VEVITTSGPPITLAINDGTMAGEARRAATALVGRLGFDETERGKVSIVATEAATNLSKHATGGEIVIQGLESGTVCGVDVLTVDRGPGMADLDRCLADGYSTAGSPGNGLGAMARLSTRFDIHSLPGIGTATLTRLWAGPKADGQPPSDLDFGAVSIPVAGEEVCGDSWAIEHSEGRILVLVVDGLGHGPQAAEAAREAVRVFSETASLGPAEIIRAAHVVLRSTRGAALAVAQIDRERGELLYAGVGNIAGAILNHADETGRISMVSHNGTVGHTIRKVQEFIYPWDPGSSLVMNSDGMGTQWQAGRYAGLTARHPGLLAGVLYRDFKRARDDVTIVVAREAGESRR